MKSTIHQHWQKFIRWIAKEELAREREMYQRKEKELAESYDRRVRELEERVNPIIEKIIQFRARFHHRPMPRIHVQAVMELSHRFWGGAPWGVDNSEQEYIAHHLARMIEKEVRYMKLVPTNEDDED